MPMTIYTSKSKWEIEFQNGGRPFFENGISFISAVDWPEIDFQLPKQMPSLNLNPEVHFRVYGRHLEKSI